MRLHRPHFTIRRLLVAVAVVALLIWPATLVMRREDYRRRADQHEDVMRTLSSELISLRRQGGQEGEARMKEGVLFEESRLAGVYRRAMDRPWRRIRPGEGDPRPPR